MESQIEDRFASLSSLSLSNEEREELVLEEESSMSRV